MAIADIRRLVYDLRPPALDELGLVAAQQAHAASLQTEELRITVHGPSSPAVLPAATEVAAYRIGAEALANAARHARARTCALRISCNRVLHIEVTDDGCGFPPALATRRRYRVDA